MLEAKVITCSVQRSAQDLYEMLWRPESFTLWASGLSSSLRECNDGSWEGPGPSEPIRITFTKHNNFGVMDHWIDLGDGHIVYVPLRIVSNEDGCEVMLTLFRQPGFSPDKFVDDEAWVRRDLAALKKLADVSQSG